VVLKRGEGARPHAKSLDLLRPPAAPSEAYDAGILLELDVIKTNLVYTCTMFMYIVCNFTLVLLVLLSNFYTISTDLLFLQHDYSAFLFRVNSDSIYLIQKACRCFSSVLPLHPKPLPPNCKSQNHHWGEGRDSWRKR